MRNKVAALVLAGTAGMWLGLAPARAQEGQIWIQIEARNTLTAAEDRARNWAGTLPEVSGFALASGWYAVALGPFADEAAASVELDRLRDSGAIPADSFLADTRLFRNRFWPAGAPVAVQPVVPVVPVAPTATEAPTAPVVATETIADARRDEAALSREGRMDIQRALQWVGTYASGIDGAFGPGTRSSISAWQAREGHEETGVLTASQRNALVDGWRGELASIGLQNSRDEEAGIEIDLPLGLVAFERYTPPFAQYAEKDDSGMQIWLISQPGDQEALYGLYDLIQSLALMPADGPRNRRPRGFDIAGSNAEVESFAQAELTQGKIQGFIVTARAADANRTARILQAMKASFRPFGAQVLDPGLVPLDDATRAGLLAGIEVKQPDLAASGFYADTSGLVLTAAANVASCGRITLDAGLEASILAQDAAGGWALLKPAVPLAPQGHAQLAAALPVAGTQVVVAGYSFGTQLPLPTLTFGRYEAAQALDGDAGRARVSLATLPGDVGGPVIGADGLVIGILQPAATDPARVLPQGVGFIAPAPAIAAALAAQGTTLPTLPSAAGTMAAEDLTAIGTAMAVQVACWK